MSDPERKPTILVVEDDPKFGPYLRALLDAEGYACHLARDSRHGRRLYEKHCPDLVIADLVLGAHMLPKLDGIELIQSLRQADTELPIIAMDGCWLAPCGCADTAIQSGATAVLTKPFPLDDLLNAVGQLLPNTLGAPPVCWA